jgi:anti-sigma B factor antagonist
MAADVNRITGGNMISTAVPTQLSAVRANAVLLGMGELGLSSQTSADGYQVVSVSGELDIATAQQVYTYLSDVIDRARTPVNVDLGGVTFCDASGLSVLARIANYAKEKGRQLKLTSARPSLLKIMRLTGLDALFPELGPTALAR